MCRLNIALSEVSNANDVSLLLLCPHYIIFFFCLRDRFYFLKHTASPTHVCWQELNVNKQYRWFWNVAFTIVMPQASVTTPWFDLFIFKLVIATEIDVCFSFLVVFFVSVEKSRYAILCYHMFFISCKHVFRMCTLSSFALVKKKNMPSCTIFSLL